MVEIAEKAINIEQENNEIVSRYRKLLKSAKPMLKSDNDAKRIRAAFDLALKAHSQQRRKSGEPYIYHPIAVAQICVEEIGLGTTSIVAALLHDVVEDTEIKLEFIEQKFGKEVATIIDGLTKIAGTFTYGTSQQAENFRKMLLTLTHDVRVILIKLADRLHNMRTLDSMSRNSQLKIASETSFLYAPLAHRLGLYTIKSELEDLSLKYTDNELYTHIVEKIQQTKASRNRFIKDFITPIENELNKNNLKFTIKGRPKSIFSIANKIKKQNVKFEEIYDLFAIRVILDVPMEEEKSACWSAYSIVTDFYKPNPHRFREWITQPKSNGYESLHTTVMSKSGQWVEVQIRTLRMDEIAERGLAAHYKYKENTPETYTREQGIEMWLNKVRESLETNEGNAIEFINDFRTSLLTDDIYVFTPQGDLKILPIGASILDFAYDIHSKLGNKAIGAKVDQKLVGLNYKLKNGEQVEILSSEKQKPNEDWLKIVATSKARNKIKEALREQNKEIALRGKEILERKARTMKLELSDENLMHLRLYFDCKNLHQLYLKIGQNQVTQTQLKGFKKFLEERNNPTKPQIQDTKTFEKEIRRIKGDKSDMLLIGEDMDKIDYTLAKCCEPIAGDDVFGFVTVTDGIKIHRTNCPNAAELMSNYGYRVIKAKWTSQSSLAFLAGLLIKGTDRMGLINDITKIISNELKVNMRSITVETESGIFEGQIRLYVQDTEHLEKLMNKLRNVKGVLDVQRFQYN